MMKTTGSLIREARIRDKMTQDTLAEKLGCTRSFICKMERGNKVIPEGLIRRASEILKIPVEDLIHAKICELTGRMYRKVGA